MPIHIHYSIFHGKPQLKFSKFSYLLKTILYFVIFHTEKHKIQQTIFRQKKLMNTKNFEFVLVP